MAQAIAHGDETHARSTSTGTAREATTQITETHGGTERGREGKREDKEPQGGEDAASLVCCRPGKAHLPACLAARTSSGQGQPTEEWGRGISPERFHLIYCTRTI